ADAGSIWFYDSTVQIVELKTQRGWNEEYIGSPYRLGEGIPGLVVKLGEAIVAREFRSDSRVNHESRNHIPKGIGGACVPLHAEESIVGVMFINVILPRE